MKSIFKYVDKSNQYYPTPEKVVKHMLGGLDDIFRFQGHKENITMLEPCAGDGSIIRVTKRWFLEHYKNMDIDIHAIEIQDVLRQSLKGQGFQVVGQDFETFESMPIYDLIVMNPPFNKGSKFILKAYELLNGNGNLFCILNAETLKNPCTKEREVLKNIIEKNGYFELIENAFENAENKTGVEIAIVYLKKPLYENEFDIFGEIKNNILTDEELHLQEYERKIKDKLSNNSEEENYEIASFDKLDNSIQIYRNAVKQIFKGIDTIEQINTSISYLGTEAKEFNIDMERFMKIILEESPEKAREKSIKIIRQMVWSYVLKLCNMDRYLFYKQREQFYDQLDKGSADLPFTKDNIMQFFDNLYQKKEEYFKKGVEDLFEEITKYHNGNAYHSEGWKTNKNWKINKKIILNYGGIEYRSWSNKSFCIIYNSIRDWINDLDKIVRFLDPANSRTPKIYEALQRHFEYLGTVGPGNSFDNNVETAYFKIKFFKKGTIHITFKNDRLLLQLNEMGAKLRKDLGYDDYGKSKEYSEGK